MDIEDMLRERDEWRNKTLYKEKTEAENHSEE
jgi:hypothetical protein